MKIFDLDNIKIIEERPDKELGQTLFYDLTETTFQSRISIGYNYYDVTRDDEMRIDLICNKLYNNTDYIDILLNVNEIDNPMNIKEGDVLKYPSIDDIELFRVRKESKSLVSQLLTKSKSPKKDESRKKYIADSFSLPPTVLPNPIEPVQQSGDNLVIGGGLFS